LAGLIRKIDERTGLMTQNNRRRLDEELTMAAMSFLVPSTYLPATDEIQPVRRCKIVESETNLAPSGNVAESLAVDSTADEAKTNFSFDG
jgi:hypothetical protein